ncbi:hypothetical protein ACFSC4_04965 [Deinococcus malanensis]|uniref:hypothetical protein n=1 Tax=Deinococcus malanensis TaxID=1706855 RepID=UPI00363781FF
MIIISREPDRPELTPLVGAAREENFDIAFSHPGKSALPGLEEAQRHVLLFDHLPPPGPDSQRHPCCLGIAVVTEATPSALSQALDCGGMTLLTWRSTHWNFRPGCAGSATGVQGLVQSLAIFLDTVSRLLWHRKEPVALHEFEVHLLRPLCVNPTLLLSTADVAATLGIPPGRAELEQIEQRLLGVSARVLRVTGQRLLVTTNQSGSQKKLLMINPHLLKGSSGIPE